MPRMELTTWVRQEGTKLVDYLIANPPWYLKHGLAIGMITGLLAVVWRLWKAPEVVLFRGHVHWKRIDPKVKELETLAKHMNRIVSLMGLYGKNLLYYVSRAQPPVDLDKLMEIVLAGMGRVMAASSYHRSSVLVPQAGSDSLVIFASVGFSPQNLHKKRYRSNTCAGYAFQQGERYYCRDTEMDEIYTKHPDPDSKGEFRSFVCVPLKAGDRTLGVFRVDAEEAEAFQDEDIQTLEFLASYVTLPLELENKVQEKSQSRGGVVTRADSS